VSHEHTVQPTMLRLIEYLVRSYNKRLRLLIFYLQLFIVITVTSDWICSHQPLHLEYFVCFFSVLDCLAVFRTGIIINCLLLLIVSIS